MQIRVSHSIGDVASDLRKIVMMVPGDLHRVVREGVRVGNTIARDNARATSGAHAKLYPQAFSSEMKVNGLGGLYAGEYGPTPGGQGSLAPILENGSVNNPAHNNLARSADMAGSALQGEVRRLPDKWFWPES